LTVGEKKANTLKPMIDQFQFDRIGYWSEVKLEILKKYAKTYSTILAAQKNRRSITSTLMLLLVQEFTLREPLRTLYPVVP
jgi:hypothetical protein